MVRFQISTVYELRLTKAFFRYEESSNQSPNDEHVLDRPEAVLNSGSEVVGGLDVDHDDGHQQEEQRHDEAQSRKKNYIINNTLK